MDVRRSVSTTGDVEALRQRLLEHCAALSPALFGWAHLRIKRFLNVHVEAEDIVQETWLRALASVTADTDRLLETDALRAWVFGIAQRVLLEEVRRSGASRGSMDATATSMFARQADTVTSICTGLARHETVRLFLRFADELEDLDRELLVRCAFEDVSASDVGRRLGVEPAAAIKRWQRLRERLQTLRLDERLGLKGA